MKTHAKLLFALSVLGCPILAKAQGLPVAAIAFAPGSDPTNIAKVLAANGQTGMLGSTGSALSHFANDPGTKITVHFFPGSTGTTGTVTHADGTADTYLCSDANSHFVDPKSEERLKSAGEYPADPSNVEKLTWGHEVGHVVTTNNHGGSENIIEYEADVIKNYENNLRSAAGESPRNTYLGNNLPANQSSWQSFWSWFKSIFE